MVASVALDIRYSRRYRYKMEVAVDQLVVAGDFEEEAWVVLEARHHIVLERC